MAKPYTQSAELIAKWLGDTNRTSENLGDPVNVYTSDGSYTAHNAAYPSYLINAGTYTHDVNESNAVVLSLNDLNTRKVKRDGDLLTGNFRITQSLIVDVDSISGNVISINKLMTVGGYAAPTVNDGLDSGMLFRWHNGTTAKLGYFGYVNATGKFTFIPDAVDTAGIMSGALGTLDAHLSATNLTVGTIDPTILANSTLYVGTTAVPLNRASANQALTGISSITLPGSTSGTIQLIASAIAGASVITLPATTGTLATDVDVSNAAIMYAIALG